MKLLTLFRHAKSVQDPAFPIDRERPLSSRGLDDAPFMGRIMRSADVMPQLIVSSPSARTRETARLFAQGAGYKGDVLVVESLYLGSTTELLEAVLALPEEFEHVMLVGHNPGMEEFAALLLGAPPGASGVRMTTGAMAHFDLSVTRWAEVEPGCGLLHWLVNPRLLKKMT